MSIATHEPTKPFSACAWGSLPARMRVLYITSQQRTGSWLAEVLATDSGSQVTLEEAQGVVAGMARLQDDLFDAVLVSHEPPELDALELAQGLRAGGTDCAILLLGAANQDEVEAAAYEVGADAYLCVGAATTRALLWAAARAIERHQLLRENRRLTQAERQRLHQERLEADRLLAEQRARTAAEMLVIDSAADVANHNPSDAPLPEKLVAHYADLLRAHVIMGSGNLSTELRDLAHLLVAANVGPQQTMSLHLNVLEELVRGLGARIARHVMTRADLLVLEVLLHLAAGYRAGSRVLQPPETADHALQPAPNKVIYQPPI